MNNDYWQLLTAVNNSGGKPYQRGNSTTVDPQPERESAT